MQIIKYIIIFLPIILALAIGIGDLKDNYIDFGEFMLMMLGAIAIIPLYNILLFLIFSKDTIEYIPQATVNKYELVSTKFNNNIEGNFYLGTGSIKDKEYIYYTVREGDEIKRKKIEQYQIFISDEQPYVVVENKLERSGSKNWLYNIDKVSEEIIEDKATFYIPENSIVQNINID